MRHDTVIYLASTVYSKNSIGDSIEKPGEYRQVFAEKKSVRQSEFYQAQATDFKPEYVFVVWTIEYEDEPFLKFNEKDYKIFRAFEVDDGKRIELVCEGLTVNG